MIHTINVAMFFKWTNFFPFLEQCFWQNKDFKLHANTHTHIEKYESLQKKEILH